MVDDITAQKLSTTNPVKNVLISVGGYYNTFKIDKTKTMIQVAQNIYQTAISLGANGIDFDLEHVGIEDLVSSNDKSVDAIRNFYIIQRNIRKTGFPTIEAYKE